MPSAETRAASARLNFTFSGYNDWSRLGHTVNGYALCDEMGVAWGDWWHSQVARYEATGRWDIPVVEMVMILFFQARSRRFVWGPDPFDLIDSLLHAIAEKTGQIYVTDPELRQRVISDMSNYPNIYDKDGKQVFPPTDNP